MGGRGGGGIDRRGRRKGGEKEGRTEGGGTELQQNPTSFHKESSFTVFLPFINC